MCSWLVATQCSHSSPYLMTDCPKFALDVTWGFHYLCWPPSAKASLFLVPGVQEKLGVMNKGAVYALWDYEAQNSDELSFHEGDAITILRRKDENETEWWWARLGDREGYVPKNLLGVSKHSAHLDLRYWKSAGLVVCTDVTKTFRAWVQFC